MSTLTIFRVSDSISPHAESWSDFTIGQTTEWINFISQTHDAEPVYAVVRDGNRDIGRFTGLLFTKFGFRILGSPFPGWSTSYMGFNLCRGTSRTDLLKALSRFAFDDLKCVHVEIMDRHVTSTMFKEAGYRYKCVNSFEIDLARSEDRLWEGLSSPCRRCIRKARHYGLQIEVSRDREFADEYYSQLEDVFAKQGLVPTYGIDRVRSLIDHLLPTGRLLLLRVRNSDKKCVATGIFPAFHDTMFFWGGASWRSYQHMRPNEFLQWTAMMYWKGKGIAKYDMGGGGDYKRKYGGTEISVPWGRKSRYGLFEVMRTVGRMAFSAKQRIAGFTKSFHNKNVQYPTSSDIHGTEVQASSTTVEEADCTARK